MVVALPDSTQLRSDFNNRLDARRVVSVVSPTCDDCLAGLGLLFTAIDGGHVSLLVLWLGMLPGDSPEAAEESAKRFAVDPPALHYWEEEGWRCQRVSAPCSALVLTIRLGARGTCICSMDRASSGATAIPQCLTHGRTTLATISRAAPD